jgi:hypothetical protein
MPLRCSNAVSIGSGEDARGEFEPNCSPIVAALVAVAGMTEVSQREIFASIMFGGNVGASNTGVCCAAASEDQGDIWRNKSSL